MLATWNVGGLQVSSVLDLCETLEEIPSPRELHILLVQEVICDADLKFEDKDPWRIIVGKNPDSWRGNAICYRLPLATHHHTATTPSRTQITRRGLR